MESASSRGRSASVLTEIVSSRQAQRTGAAGSSSETAPIRLNEAFRAQTRQAVLNEFGRLAGAASVLADPASHISPVTNQPLLEGLVDRIERGEGMTLDKKDLAVCQDLLFTQKGLSTLPARAEGMLLLTTCHVAFAVSDSHDHRTGTVLIPENTAHKLEVAMLIQGMRDISGGDLKQAFERPARHFLPEQWSNLVIREAGVSGSQLSALEDAQRIFGLEVAKCAGDGLECDRKTLLLSFLLLSLHDHSGLWPLFAFALENLQNKEYAEIFIDFIQFFLEKTRPFSRPETEPMSYAEANPLLDNFNEIDAKIPELFGNSSTLACRIEPLRDVCSSALWQLYQARKEPETFDSRRAAIVKEALLRLPAALVPEHGTSAPPGLRV